MAMVKWIKPEVMNYQKVLLKIIMLSSMERTFMTNAYNTYKMTQRKKKKLKTGQGRYCTTTGC